MLATAGHIHGYGWVVVAPKSKAGTRILTIPAAIVPDIQIHLSCCAEQEPEGRVLRGPRGGSLRSSTFMSRDFTSAVQSAGLTGARFHDLRHTGGHPGRGQGVRRLTAGPGRRQPAASARRNPPTG